MKILISALVSCVLVVSCTKNKNEKLEQSSVIKTDRAPTQISEASLKAAIDKSGAAADLKALYDLEWSSGSEAKYSSAVYKLIVDHGQAFNKSIDKNDYEKAYLDLQILSLQPLGGFLYKMSDIVENLGNRQMHNAALSMINSTFAAADLNLNAGTAVDFNNYLLDYIALPHTASGVVKFTSAKDFFNFVCPTTEDTMSGKKICSTDNTSLYCKMGRNHVRLKYLYDKFTKSGKNFIAWDNRVASAANNFSEGGNNSRYLAVTESVLLGQLAANKSTLNNMATTCAYNFEGTLTLLDNISKAFVSGTLFPGFIRHDGVPANQRKQVLTKHREKNEKFGMLRGGDQAVNLSTGKRLMAEALTHLEEGIQFSLDAEKVFSNEYQANADTVNKVLFGGNDSSKKLMLNKIKGILENGTYSITSLNTGKTVTIKVKDVYTNPPKDLMAFTPQSFNTGVSKVMKLENSRISLRNYRYGSAKTWSKSSFDTYVTGLESGDSAFIPSLIRTASTSFGGGLILGPLAFVQ